MFLMLFITFLTAKMEKKKHAYSYYIKTDLHSFLYYNSLAIVTDLPQLTVFAFHMKFSTTQLYV